MPVRYEFERELNELHRNLVKMGALIEKQIDDMMIAMLDQNVDVARQVIDKDDIIDDLERVMEEACILMIARQQPIASDLRDIASILKMITDLERIADHCEDISKYIIKLSKLSYMKPLPNIEIMAEKVKVMVSTVIDSCVRSDLKLSEVAANMDDEVDDLFHASVQELKQIMKENSEFVEQSTCYLFIVKYLERMGDHAGNIAGWIKYNVTGNHFE